MVVFMIDADNLSSPAWVEEAFQRLERVEGSVAVRRAYGSAENLKGLAEVMRIRAIRPFVNLPLSKNTTDLALAVDAMELACRTPAPAVLVIGSGDADFVPLVVRLRERGIRMVCVSESSKMAPEAESAYDQFLFVGADQRANAPAPVAAAPDPARPVRAAAKRVPAKKVAAAHVPARKAVAKKSAANKEGVATAPATVARILDAAPALAAGEWQSLGEVVKSLHDARLLGKNAALTKFFNKFADDFELAPARQPNRVRFIGPP